MTKQIIDGLQDKFVKAIAAFKGDLLKVRTGRATPNLLDGVRVDYYGTQVPISQVGTVTCPEPRLIQVQPWESNLLQAIEKAILVAGLGLNPQNDGKILRIPLPALTEERRKDLVKQVKKQGEEYKVTVRNERRNANEDVKKLEKEHKISQDDMKKAQDLVQKKTDEFIAEIDKLLVAKEKEIMTV